MRKIVCYTAHVKCKEMETDVLFLHGTIKHKLKNVLITPKTCYLKHQKTVTESNS